MEVIGMEELELLSPEERWFLSPKEKKEILQARKACMKLKNLARSRNVYALMLYRRALNRYGEILKRVRVLRD
jgi:hypothetical protein